MQVWLKGRKRSNGREVQVPYDTPVDVGPPILRKAVVSLTDAQIKALPSTAVNIVAAPGEGKAIFPVVSIWKLDTREAQYSNFNGAAEIHLNVGAWNLCSYIDAFDNAFTGWLGRQPLIYAYSPQNGSSGSVTRGMMLGAVSEVENLPLQIKAYNAGSGAFTGGDPSQSLEITVYYMIYDV